MPRRMQQREAVAFSIYPVYGVGSLHLMQAFSSRALVDCDAAITPCILARLKTWLLTTVTLQNLAE